MRRGLALLVVLAATGCGGSGAVRHAVQSPGQAVRVQTVRRALLARLKKEEVNFRWVVCVRNGRTFRHLPVIRCNVNFAVEPHVEVYCTVLDRGHLVTNHEDSAIPCGHDNAGGSVPVESS